MNKTAVNIHADGVCANHGEHIFEKQLLQIENPGALSVATVMLEAFASVMTTAHASQGDGSGSGCQTKSWIWSNETQTAFVGNDSEKSIRKPSQLPYESTNRSFLGSIFSCFFFRIV